jgi:CubicO group peptidase (beta-lactamase class C family)
MTVRDLMRHTAGLTYGMGSTAVDSMYISNNVEDSNATSTEMVTKLANLPLQDQPGTRFNYSIATDVLGRVIEVVSGKPLDVFLRERVLGPLDMRDTGFVVPANKLDRFTAAYESDGRGGLKVTDSAGKSWYRSPRKFLSGGGGLVSTARDYLRFCQMLLNGGELDGKRLLRKETVGEMTTNQIPPEGLPISLGGIPLPGHGIGLGLLVRMDAAATKPAIGAGEYSWSGAASTFFWVAPKSELIVIVLQQVEPLQIGLLMGIKPIVYGAVVE